MKFYWIQKFPYHHSITEYIGKCYPYTLKEATSSDKIGIV